MDRTSLIRIAKIYKELDEKDSRIFRLILNRIEENRKLGYGLWVTDMEILDSKRWNGPKFRDLGKRLNLNTPETRRLHLYFTSSEEYKKINKKIGNFDDVNKLKLNVNLYEVASWAAGFLKDRLTREEFNYYGVELPSTMEEPNEKA